MSRLAVISPKRTEALKVDGPVSPMNRDAVSVPAYRLYGEKYIRPVYSFFHIEPFSVRTVPNNWRIGPHSHPDFDQLSILLEGKCSFRHDGKETFVGSPSCIFTPANVVHEFSCRDDARGYVISVSPDFVSGLPSVEGALNAAILRLAANRIVPFPSKRVVSIVEALISLLSLSFDRAGESRRDTLRYLLSCLFLELDRLVPRHHADGERHTATNDNTELHKRFRELLRSAVGSIGFSESGQPRPNTVEMLSRHLSTTPYALNKACRDTTGWGAHEILQEEMLQHAKRLLLYSNIPIKEIAFVLGYAHASHFARFFKKRTRMTPDQFRNEYRMD